MKRSEGNGQRATGEELGSKRAVFSVEEGHAVLVVQGKLAGADAEPWRGTTGARQKWRATILRIEREGACLLHRHLPAAEPTPNTRVPPPRFPFGDT